MKNRKKKFIAIIPGGRDEIFLHKDFGMIPYFIGHNKDYEATYAYLSNSNINLKNTNFEKYCKLLRIGETTGDYHKDRKIVMDFIKQNIHNYDIVNFYNYGTSTYKYAYHCKKYNSRIIIWSKLDMGMGGYRHFREDNFLRKIKNYFERFKSQYVDLFSVETYEYYKNLKDNIMFKNRLIYFPNGVEIIENDKISLKKENVILHVARMGSEAKNSELLVKALDKVRPEIIKNWKVYLIGTYTDEFKSFLDSHLRKNANLKQNIILKGEIRDRELLYRYYSKSKIFILTSRHESFGIAALEALYHKNYLLLSNYGLVVNDLIDNGRYGKVIDSFDANIWAKEIEQTILDENVTEKVKDARYFVLNRFDYENNVGKLINKINALMKS